MLYVWYHKHNYSLLTFTNSQVGFPLILFPISIAATFIALHTAISIKTYYFKREALKTNIQEELMDYSLIHYELYIQVNNLSYRGVQPEHFHWCHIND